MKHKEATKILEDWAKKNHVTFVSRSHGQCSTDTISYDALLELVQGTSEEVAPALMTPYQKTQAQARTPSACPNCGCDKFQRSSTRTANYHSAWHDGETDLWFDGPALETSTTSCAAECGWSMKVDLRRGKIVDVHLCTPAVLTPTTSPTPPDPLSPDAQPSDGQVLVATASATVWTTPSNPTPTDSTT